MSWNFDGNDDWVGNTTTAPVTALPATIACWFNADVFDNHMINVSNSTGNNKFILRLDSAANVVSGGVTDGGTNDIFVTTTSLTINTWNHACITFESTTSRKLYSNGINEGTDTNSRNPSNFTRLHIGSRRDSSNTSAFFDGQMADVGIWNVALSAPEIFSLARGASCSLVRPQSLVFYAPLIRELLDISKNKLALSIGGSASVDASQRHPRIYL